MKKEIPTLAADAREPRKKLAALRAGKQLPAVFYGTKVTSTPIVVPLPQFVKVWRQAGESGVVTLDVGGKKDVDVLIHEVARDPVTGTPIHADFYAIDKDKKVTVAIPLEFVGEAPVVKSGEGTVVKVMHELEVEALPRDLPHEFEIDISGLVALDSSIAVKDVKMPEGVEAVAEPDETVVSVAAQVEMEEEEPEEALDMESIEDVDQKGKQEEGDDESDSNGGESGEKEEGKE